MKYNTDVFENARRYAAADRTDPFSLSRCLAHMRCGVASRGADYSADHFLEERLIKAGDRSLTAVVSSYKSVVRP